MIFYPTVFRALRKVIFEQARASFFKRIIFIFIGFSFCLQVVGLDTSLDYRLFSPSGEFDKNPYNVVAVDDDYFNPGDKLHCRWGTFQDYHDVGGTLSNPFPIVPEYNPTLWYSNTTIDPPSWSLFLTTEIETMGNWFDLSNPDLGASPSSVYHSIDFDLDAERFKGEELYLLRRLHLGINKAFDPNDGQILWDNKKLIILIHGWNPDELENSYGGGNFSKLTNELKSAVADSDWKILRYKWERDAATGPKLVEGGEGVASTRNPSEAAETGHYHGYHLGELVDHMSPDLERVHIIAHSAGTWVLRSAVRYLLEHSNATVQVTLLDPFIAAETNQSISLTKQKIEDIENFPGYGNIYMLENLYAKDVWLDSDQLYRATSQEFYWVPLFKLTANQRVDWESGNTKYYRSHDGPIGFYADTVKAAYPNAIVPESLSNPDLNLDEVGWQISMFMNEPVFSWSTTERRISEGDDLTLSAPAISRNGSLSGSASWKWYRNGSRLYGQNNETLTISTVTTADSGAYSAEVTHKGLTARSPSFSVVVGSLTLPAPSNLTARAVSEDQINISWTDNSSNESGFRVERRAGGGYWSSIDWLPANTTAYSDTSLQASTTYDYRVAAYDSSGTFVDSGIASATTFAEPGSTFTLSLRSENPSSGVSMNSFVGSGSFQSTTTPASRSFSSGTQVTVTCPATLTSGQVFQRWKLDGEDYSFSDVVTVTMNAAHTLTAVYGSEPTPTRTLVGVEVDGPSTVSESSSAQYRARAIYSDGSESYIAATWIENSSYSSISSSGVLDTTPVGSDKDILVSAIYTENSTTKYGSKAVTILDTSSSTTYSLSLSGTNGHINPSPDGPTYDAGDEVRLTAYADDNYVFSHWSGHASGTDRRIYLTMDSNKSVTAHFTVDTSEGDLIGYIEPPEAAAEGGGWKVWGPQHYFNNYKPDGDSYSGLDPGDHYVRFESIPGWITPERQTVQVVGGQSNTVTGVYQEILSTVQVTLAPDGAAEDGAQWRLSGFSDWMPGGTTLDGVPSGNYTLEFSDAGLWQVPPSRNVTIARASTNIYTVNYEPPAGIPVVFGFTPSRGPLSGGTEIRIRGANFGSSASVEFGNSGPIEATVLSASEISVTLPTSTSYGTVPVEVTTAGQTLVIDSGFTYEIPVSSNMTLLSQSGGSIEAVAASGSRVVFSESNSMVVADYSNPSRPIRQGEIALPGKITDLEIVGNLVLVANARYGLHIVDISDPMAPSRIGFYDTPRYAYRVIEVDGMAYVADSTSIQVLDISDPTAPAFRASFESSGYFAQNMEMTVIDGRIICLAGGDPGVSVIDATELDRIELLTVIEPGRNNTSFDADGDRVIVTRFEGSTSRTAVYDISTPESPALVDVFSSSIYYDTVVLDGGYYYVADGAVRIHNSYTGEEYVYYDLEGSSHDADLEGNILYIANDDRLSAVNVNNKSAPVLLSTVGDAFEAGEVVVDGDFAYIALGGSYSWSGSSRPSLITYDITSLEAPLRLNTLSAETDFDALYLSSGYLYGRTQTRGLYAFSIANPSMPSYHSKRFSEDNFYSGTMFGSDYLILGEEDRDGFALLKTVSLESPSNTNVYSEIQLADEAGLPWECTATDGRYVYTFTSNHGLTIVDYADIAQPSFVGFLAYASFGRDLAVSDDGNYAYLVANDGLAIIDCSDRSAPELTSTYKQNDQNGISVCLIDDLVAYGDYDGVRILDVSNPSEPTLVAYYNLPGNPYSIKSRGSELFVADGSGGFTILRLDDVDLPLIEIAQPSTNSQYSTTERFIDLAGTASDRSGLQSIFWANDRGGSGDATGLENWAITEVELYRGENRMTVFAKDLAGNVSQDEIVISFEPEDTIFPVVAITGPSVESEFAVDIGTISLDGTYSDNVAVESVSWSLDGGPSGEAQLASGYWSVDEVDLAEGPNVLSVTATDTSGNQSTDSAVIFYEPPDTEAPSVTIDFPTASVSYLTYTNTINLSGTAGDNRLLDRVEWASSTGESGTAEAGNVWSINGIPLTAGLNVIDVTVYDSSGNSQTDTLSVTYVPPGMHLELKAGWNQIAIPVDMADMTVEAVLGAHLGKIDKVIGGGGNFTPGFAFNTLTEFRPGVGYWVKVNEACTLELLGAPMDLENVEIELQAGWNHVGYLGMEEAPIETALAEIIDKVEKVIGDGGNYTPGFQFNTLNSLKPGVGYWIKVSDELILTYE